MQQLLCDGKCNRAKAYDASLKIDLNNGALHIKYIEIMYELKHAQIRVHVGVKICSHVCTPVRPRVRHQENFGTWGR